MSLLTSAEPFSISWGGLILSRRITTHMYHFDKLEKDLVVRRHQGLKILRTRTLLLRGIYEENLLAFPFSGRDWRRQNLYKFQKFRTFRLQCFLLHLSHPNNPRYITIYKGNFNKNIITTYDSYIAALVPVFILLCLTLFYLCWKSHFYSQIEEEENKPSNVKPEKFCLEVVCDDLRHINATNLRTIFENFGPIHEISIIRRFKGHLSHFK